MIQRGGTIGILGGGQLGRMLALAAAPLGYRCHVFCPEKNGPASEVCAKHTEAPYTNKEALKEFSSQVDIVTYEFENVPVEATRLIEKNVSVFPSSLSLHICSNRKNEKEFAAKNGIATAPWEYVPDRETLGKAIKKIGCPAILKSEESGYDGKGQALIKSEKNSKLDLAWDSIGRVPAILEKQISFEREISVILARDNNDICTVYPPIQNTHKNGILDYSISPAIMGKLQLQKATDIATSVARGLNHIGVLCVELFVNPDGELLLNEVAPRVHNSGHLTIDACHTSQFSQHIRAIVGLPLEPPNQHSNAAMKNLIGEDINSWIELDKSPNSFLHLYGKNDIRNGRKMGHVTWLYSPKTKPKIQC